MLWRNMSSSTLGRWDNDYSNPFNAHEDAWRTFQQKQHLANTGFNTAAAAADRTYQLSIAAADRDLNLANNQADRDWTVATVTADETYSTKLADSQYDYEEVLATEWKDYRLDAAAGYATEMTLLAIGNGSPWAEAQAANAQAEN